MMATHTLALPLVGLREGGVPVVRVVPANMMHSSYAAAAASALFDFNTKPYYGARVLRINGRPAWQAILWWVNYDGGGYHNMGQRVNAAFAHWSWDSSMGGPPTRSVDYGTFAQRTNIGKQTFVTMVLQRLGGRRPETVRVPWLGAMPFFNVNKFRNSRVYRNSFFSKPPVSVKASRHQDQNEPSRSHTAQPSWLGTLKRTAVSAGNGESAAGGVPSAGSAGGSAAAGLTYKMQKVPRIPSVFQPTWGPPKRRRKYSAGGNQIGGGEDLWEVYKLSDGKTGVVVISTFAPDAPSKDADRYFVTQTLKAFRKVRSKGCSQVIIDVSSNGGGVVYYGSLLIQMLVGTKHFSKGSMVQNDNLHYLADTPFVHTLRNRNVDWYAWNNWYNVVEKPYTPRTSSNFFWPLRRVRFARGGPVGSYSNAFKQAFAARSLQSLLQNQVLPPVLGKMKYMLLSDGLCFSTCGTFSATMRRQFKIPLVTVGGLPYRPMQFAGGAGGFIAGDVTSLLKSWSSYPKLAKRPDAPKSFSGPISMGMRFAFGSFNAVDPTPLEFTPLSGDFMLKYSLRSVADPTIVYLQAAALFDRLK